MAARLLCPISSTIIVLPRVRPPPDAPDSPVRTCARAPCPPGASPLLIAAFAGSTDVASQLIEKGADITIVDSLGRVDVDPPL